MEQTQLVHDKIQKVKVGDFVRVIYDELISNSLYAVEMMQNNDLNLAITPNDILTVKEVYKHFIIAEFPEKGRLLLHPHQFELLPQRNDNVYFGINSEGSYEFIKENELYNKYRTIPQLHPMFVNKPESNVKTCELTQAVDGIYKSKEENKMSMANELNKMFGAIQPGMCRLSMNGGVAVKTSSGYKSYNMKTGRLVNCDNFALDPGAEWFFCIPTNHVKTGDIILINGKPCCVKAVNNDQITVINYENNTIDTVLPERHMFMGNMYFYSKVVSPFNSGKKGKGVKKLMKYVMMSEMLKGGFNGMMGSSTVTGQTANAGMNPMMMAMMFGGGGFSDLFDGMFDEDEDGDAFGFMGNFFEDDEEEETQTPVKRSNKKSRRKAKKPATQIDEDEEDDDDNIKTEYEEEDA